MDSGFTSSSSKGGLEDEGEDGDAQDALDPGKGPLDLEPLRVRALLTERDQLKDQVLLVLCV